MSQNTARFLQNSVDVLVVGSTPQALSAATHLARGAAEVLLVPLVSSFEQEPCRHSLGLLTFPMDDNPDVLSDSLGADGMDALTFAASALQMVDSSIVERSGSFSEEKSPRGILHAAANATEKQHLIKSLPLLNALGLDVQWVDSLQATKLAGLPGPPLWHGALVIPGGGRFDPLERHNTLLFDAKEAGVHFADFGHDLELKTDGVREIAHLGGRTVRCELVLLADGVHSNAVAPEYASMHNLARVQGVLGRQRQGKIPPHTATKAKTLFPWTANGGFESGYMDPSGSLTLSGYRYMDVELGMSLDGPDFLDKVSQRHDRELRKMLGGETETTGRFVRWIDIGCDSFPIAGPVPGKPRRLLLLGLGEHEFVLGTALGRAMAEAMLGVGSGPPGIFSPRRIL